MAQPAAPSFEEAYARIRALPAGTTGEILEPGVVRTMSRPGRAHARAAKRCLASLAGFDVESGGTGWWVLVEYEIAFPLGRLVVPDLAGWRVSRVPELPDENPLAIVPDWCCEVLSPTTESIDRTVKLPLYAASGVSWVWLVDPRNRTVEVFETVAGRATFAGALRDEGTALLPPFDAPVTLVGWWLRPRPPIAAPGTLRSSPSMPRRPIDRQMRSQLVRPVLALVASRGGDVDALVKRFGLPPDARTAPEVVLPLREFRAFLDAAELAAGDPFLGLTIAATLPRGTYGVLEFASRTAPTVREAMARVVRYMGLLNEIVGVSLREEGGEGVVEQFVDGEPACLGRHANEFFLAFMLASSRAMAGADIRASRVYFAHPAPKDTSPLARVFGTRSLAFDKGRNGMALPSSTLDLPLVTSDPPLHSLLDQQAAAALGERPPTSRFVGTVERHVKAQLSGKEPSIADVASALRMSARTLQRRLAAEGVRWNDLVDGARRELALRYVEAGDRALGEIAYLLGYAELSPFIRAFKRWTGTTPTAMRGARG